MQVFNTTTGMDDLLWHPSYGTDVMADIVGSRISNLVFSEARGCYEGDAGEIQWWRDWIDADVKTFDMYAEMPQDAADDIKAEAGDCDMEDEAPTAIKLMNEWATSNGRKFVTYSDGSVGLEGLDRE